MCRCTVGERTRTGLCCTICGWHYGDFIDADLERPKVHVVYYLRYRDRIKIGTTHNPRQRLQAIWHDEVLAFERGGRELERRRHAQFAGLREGGEWFTATEELRDHAREIRGDVDPLDAYSRWYAEALARIMP